MEMVARGIGVFPMPVAALVPMPRTALVVAGLTEGARDVGTVVATRSGRVEGASVGEEGRMVRTFEGTPDAAPPVGDLRWRRRDTASSW